MALAEEVVADSREAAAKFAELDKAGTSFTIIKSVIPYVDGEATDADGNTIGGADQTTVSYAFRYDVPDEETSDADDEEPAPKRKA